MKNQWTRVFTLDFLIHVLLRRVLCSASRGTFNDLP